MRVSAVTVIKPPITTMANGRWISEPGPVANNSGTRPKAVIFTSTPVAAHGLSTAALNPMERVMGRAKAVQIQLVVERQQLTEVLQSLKEEFPNTGLRYWTVQVSNFGEFV